MKLSKEKLREIIKEELLSEKFNVNTGDKTLDKKMRLLVKLIDQFNAATNDFNAYVRKHMGESADEWKHEDFVDLNYGLEDTIVTCNTTMKVIHKLRG